MRTEHFGQIFRILKSLFYCDTTLQVQFLSKKSILTKLEDIQEALLFLCHFKNSKSTAKMDSKIQISCRESFFYKSWIFGQKMEVWNSVSVEVGLV